MLGIGSELRGDDIAGVLVARKLQAACKRLHLSELRLGAFDGASAPENLTGEIARFQPSHLVVVDAAHLGLEPGDVELIAEEQIGGISFSTHTLPVRIILDYLRKTVGCTALVLGIQPEQTEVCAAPSEPVLAAVDRVVAAFVAVAKAQAVAKA